MNRGPRWFVQNILFLFVVGLRVSILQGDDPVELWKQEEVAFQAAATFAQTSVVRIETFGGREVVEDSAVASGPSSGTAIDRDGWIVTSLFQLRGEPAAITVILPNGQRYAAKLVARDHARAIGLLKIDAPEGLFPAIHSKRSSWRIGQWTIALGKTFDLVEASQSVGILSATDRIFGRAIQTDCKVSPHNYGGPLIDLRGHVMGILAPIDPGIATEGEVQQWYDSGIGFAIPIEDILARLPKMKRGEDIYPGKAGIRPKVNDDFRGPVVLAGVAPGTPAAKAGLKPGDQLTKINGMTIAWPNHMRHALGVVDANDSVAMTVLRDTKELKVDVTLVQELPVYRTPFLGILADSQYKGPGIRVQGIYPDSPAKKAGLAVGQVIRKIDDREVSSLAELDQQLAFVDYREPLKISFDKEADSKDSAEVATVTLTPWPDQWDSETFNLSRSAEEQPDQSKAAAKDKSATGVVPLVMADIPNQAFAYVPTNYASADEHGLLVIMPNPGKIDRKLWVDRWEKFCRENRFIVAVVASADPERWQREELDIVKRTIQQLRTTYEIDPRRISLSGQGAGSAPAFVLAMQNRALFRGLWLAEGTIPRGLGLPQAEPQESPAILLQGKNPVFPRFVEAANKLGYRAAVADPEAEVIAESMNVQQQKSVEVFLSSLAWF
jgi:serine protease Do